MIRLRLIFVVLLAFVVAGLAHADLMPDYYAEPGLNSHRDYLNLNEFEHIDPFTGMLQHHVVDLEIPGNSGLDLRISRSYNSPNGRVGDRSVNGVGWEVHFGKVLIEDREKLCSTIWGANTTDNPIIQLPDGSIKLLVYASAWPDQFLYITHDYWKADCTTDYSGLIVTSPDGTTYLFDEYDFSGTLSTWRVTEIRDANGNTIHINYTRGGVGNGVVLVDTVTTSDGRTLYFTYADKDTESVRLTRVSISVSSLEEGQVSDADTAYVQYEYVPVENHSGSHYLLARVRRSDDSFWEYAYNDGPAGATGAYAMQSARTPYGGLTSYVYKSEYFPDGTPYPPKMSVVGSKTTDGQTWTFDYDQDLTRDLTTVTAPDGTLTAYAHWGVHSTSSGEVWKVGLLQYKEQRSADGAAVQRKTYEWQGQPISTEQYWRTSRPMVGKIDDLVYTPYLVKKTTVRDGSSYATEYQDNAYGLPQTLVELPEHVSVLHFHKLQKLRKH